MLKRNVFLFCLVLVVFALVFTGCRGKGRSSTGEDGDNGYSTLTLKSDGTLDGHVAHFFGGTNHYGINNYGNIIQVGSSHNWGDDTRIGFRGFFSFDLSIIPAGIDITSVTLRVYQAYVSGDPYGKLGNLLVEHVSYDTLVHAADGTTQYTLAPSDNTIPATARLSTDQTEGYKTLDVTAAVRADLAASRSHAQFRLRFEKETADDKSSN